MKQFDPHWTDKICREIRLSLKSDMNNGHFALRPVYVYVENFFRHKLLKKFTTHILCSVTFFFRKSCRLWYNLEKYGSARQATYDNIMRRMETNAKLSLTLRICNTNCFCTANMVARTRINVTLYVHCLSYYSYVTNQKMHIDAVLQTYNDIFLCEYTEYNKPRILFRC
jgi:hypothetical protein